MAMVDVQEEKWRRPEVIITRSAGSDNAWVIFIDTEFEPDASDGGPGLRVMLNDETIYLGIPMGDPMEEEDET